MAVAKDLGGTHEVLALGRVSREGLDFVEFLLAETGFEALFPGQRTLGAEGEGPLGFALENFDAIGGWRSTEAGSPIDSSGVLPDGTQFEGASGLRKVLLGRREAFVMNVTEKLLTYALGRGVEYYDAPAIRSVMRQAAPDDYRWSSLITGIVKSTPFQLRRSAEP